MNSTNAVHSSPNPYQRKQEERRQRYKHRAEAARAEASRNFNGPAGETLHGMMGEPVKVGHHSERRHRNLIKKAHREMDRGCEAMRKAEHYEAKAAGVGTGGISSDDPDALDKLDAELAQAEKKQDIMKKANRIVRSKKSSEDKKRAQMAELGLTGKTVDLLLNPQFSFQRPGFQDYELKNNNANIRRIKSRIAQMEAADEAEDVVRYYSEGVEYREVEYREEENRVRLVFPGKPDYDTRQTLKRHGFRWSRQAGAWQRFLNSGGRAAAQSVIELMGLTEQK